MYTLVKSVSESCMATFLKATVTSLFETDTNIQYLVLAYTTKNNVLNGNLPSTRDVNSE
jgi:hypothetical protein